MIQANKFTFSYDRVEDRLKMLVNYDSPTSRIDFFITRAMLIRLVPVIEQILIKAQTSQKPQNDTPKPSRLGTQIATDQSTMKLLEAHKVYLLEKIDFQYQANKNTVILMFSAAGEVQCSARLTTENFSQVMNAMISAIPHTSWGIAPNILLI